MTVYDAGAFRLICLLLNENELVSHPVNDLRRGDRIIHSQAIKSSFAGSRGLTAWRFSSAMELNEVFESTGSL